MEPSEGAASTIGASDHRRFSPIRKYTRKARPPQMKDLKDVATQTSPRSSPVRVGNKKIMHILKGCDEGFDTRHSMPEIIQLLEQDGLCYRMALPPELVGIHPATRAAHDFSSESVHWIGSDLVKDAGAWPESAYAVEDGPDEQIRNFNLQITSSSVGLATLSHVAYGSIAGSLVNHFLCCVNAAVPCGIKHLSVDGRMCKDRIIDRRNCIEGFLRKGLEWTIFSRDVPILYPTFIEHAVRRLNVFGGLNRLPNEFAVMSRFLWCAKQCEEENNGIVHWDRVRANVDHRNTSLGKDIIDAILVFVKKWGLRVQSICDFYTLFVAGERKVPVETYLALNQVKDATPHLVAAIVMAQVGCPWKYVGAPPMPGRPATPKPLTPHDHTVCRYISYASVHSLFKNKSAVTAAESNLKLCHDIMTRSSAPEHTKLTAYGQLCVRCVKLIMNKKQTPPVRTTLEGVCHDFAEALRVLDNPFLGDDARTAIVDGAAPTPMGVGTTDDIVAQAVEKSGFTAGTLIKLNHAGDGRVWRVDGVDVDGELLLFAADSLGRVNPSITMRVLPKDLPHWKAEVTPGELLGSAGAHMDFRKQQGDRTHIVAAMQRAVAEHPDPPMRTEMTHRTAVHTTGHYPKGELCLVYATDVVCPVTADNVEELTGVGRRCRLVPPRIGMNFGNPIEYMLLPPSMESRSCAAWRVSTVNVKEEANMTIDHRECQVPMQPTDEGTHTCSIRIVSIPILVNSMRAIISGEELLVFEEQPPIGTRKRPAGLDTAASSAKRARGELWTRLCTDAASR